MIREVMEFLSPEPDGVYVDATLGLGGYAEAILEITEGAARVIGIDVDEDSLKYAESRLEGYAPRVEFVRENFSHIDEILNDLGIGEVDGIVADVGMSSYQIESSGRGFSFLREEPLDMRFDTRLDTSAKDIVNTYTFDELSTLIKVNGEERWAKKIARDIIKVRSERPIRSSLELAEIVSRAIPKKFHPRDIHPATRTFQALRIAVNNELQNLKLFISKAAPLLKPGGKIAVVSFHSLEDRVVKKAFKKLASPCTCPPDLPVCVCHKKKMLNILTPAPITPSMEEAMENRRARSAKLRGGERTQNEELQSA